MRLCFGIAYHYIVAAVAKPIEVAVGQERSGQGDTPPHQDKQEEDLPDSDPQTWKGGGCSGLPGSHTLPRMGCWGQLCLGTSKLTGGRSGDPGLHMDKGERLHSEVLGFGGLVLRMGVRKAVEVLDLEAWTVGCCGCGDAGLCVSELEVYSGASGWSMVSWMDGCCGDPG